MDEGKGTKREGEKGRIKRQKTYTGGREAKRNGSTSNIKTSRIGSKVLSLILIFASPSLSSPLNEDSQIPSSHTSTPPTQETHPRSDGRPTRPATTTLLSDGDLQGSSQVSLRHIPTIITSSAGKFSSGKLCSEPRKL